MIQKFECPACGESKRLKGNKRGPKADDQVDIHCLACGHDWTYDPLICTACGGQMVAERRPLLVKARGSQQSIIGFNTVRVCPTCEPPDDKSDGWMSASE